MDCNNPVADDIEIISRPDQIEEYRQAKDDWKDRLGRSDL